MKSEFVELERLSEGYTNQVYLTGQGTVLKEYTNFSVFSLLYSLLELVLRGEMMTARDRIENTKLVREKLEEKAEFPEIIRDEGRYLEFEYVNAEDVLKYLNKNPSEADEIGRKVGELMKKFHENDVFLLDWALDDILVEDDPVVVDTEFGGRIDYGFRKTLDKISLFSRAGRLDDQTYRDFLEGVRDEVGISHRVEAVGLILSLGFNLVYFRDGGKPKKVLSKILN